MNRREFLGTGAALLASASAGTADATSTERPAAPSTPARGPGLSKLTLTAAQAGVAPYLATVYPLAGAVPNGSTVASDDDPSLSCSVLSRWPDGSAAVAVLAGHTTLAAGTAKGIALRSAPAPSSAPLTTARVSALLTEISIDVAGVGTVQVDNFTTPNRVWWSNARVICCRYHAPLDGTFEAVIDVHAFSSDHALVEVVIENGRIDTSAASPARPATRPYEAATVRVNGQPVATVAAPGAGQPYRSGRGGGRYAGGHEAFRAWYCATWIGGGPRVEVTHDATSLQAHPLFFRVWKDANDDFRKVYQEDAYTPWSAGRLNVPAMPSGGDIEGIGPLTQWDARYIQSGSRFARRAVIASALGALSCNINARAPHGGVPSHAEASGRSQGDGTWPRTASEPAWELAHHPAVGLVAFLCQPSPVFIEIAQRIALWNATALTRDGTFGFWAQVRGKAWGIRSLAHAIFITPDGDRWKPPARGSLAANVRLIDSFRTSPNAKLGFVWFPTPAKCADFEARNEGMQQPLWMHHFLVLSLDAAERAQLLAGNDQRLLTTVADWAAMQPVRYVNEARGGEWRLHNYLTTVGRANVTTANGGESLGSGIVAGSGFDALPTYADNFAWYYTDSPPPSAGAFIFIETDPGRNPDYRSWRSAKDVRSAGISYASIFWAALTVAVERGVPGAEAAWSKVTGNITNLASWSSGFAAEPRYNRYPRNK